MIKIEGVLVPFYRGAVAFTKGKNIMKKATSVLVPFYRGAVVFDNFCDTKF